MQITLGDGFNHRKKLAADITSWTNRLAQAARDSRKYTTKEIEGKEAFEPEPGTEKLSERHYTIEECKSKLAELIEADRIMALRISITNQAAKSTIIDLDGKTTTLTVPELLVLRNEIIPKLESVARSTPTRPDDVNIFEEGDGFMKYRILNKVEKKKTTISEEGHKIDELILEGYQVQEYTEYGIPKREAWDEIDRIQEFAERVKMAINDANKTELLELDN